MFYDSFAWFYLCRLVASVRLLCVAWLRAGACDWMVLGGRYGCCLCCFVFYFGSLLRGLLWCFVGFGLCFAVACCLVVLIL